MKIIAIKKSESSEMPIELNYKKAEEVRSFHQTIPEYDATPLVSLMNLSQLLGVKKIYVKDESKRFGLNSFKALGASYAINKVISEQPASDNTAKMTFATATDGNHGRGVAWSAARLGCESYVCMPKGTAPERLENVLKLGSHAEISDMSYDDCVRYVKDTAQKEGWITIQDTASDSNDRVPSYIMQGYTTMALEIVEQLGDVIPTHIFLQAGVGSMAGAIAGFMSEYYKKNKPIITIVEPDGADCIFRTAKAGDGELHFVTNTHTMMAGLNCGEPCKTAWEILEQCADYALSCADFVSADGMRILGNPLSGDTPIISGESGAVGVGVVAHLMRDASLQSMRDTIGLGENSVVLCISTEGDTDKENYRNIVWFD